MISFYGQALEGSAFDIGDGLSVPVHAHDHGPVERGVSLAVATAVEPMTGRLS